MDKFLDNEKIFTDKKLKFEICFLIFLLIVLLFRKYQLQNKIKNTKPNVEKLVYLENNKKHILVKENMAPDFIAKGWVKVFSFLVFKGKFMDSKKFIVYNSNNNLLVAQEGETVPIEAKRQMEFFAFGSLEDSTIKTKPVMIGYIKENDKTRSIICMSETECVNCDRTQTIHVPI